jgi:hypothetical protein
MFVCLVMAAVAAFVSASAFGALTPGQKMAAETIIKDFSSKDFDVRQKAVDRLIAIGADVAPVVRKTLAETKDSEVKLRCEMVLKGLRDAFGAEAVDGAKAEAPVQTPGKDLPPSKITISVKEAGLEDILQKFADQSKNSLIHMPDKWNGEPVMFEVKDMPYWQALDKLAEVLGGYYYNYDYSRSHGTCNGMTFWKRAKGTEFGADAGPVVVKLDYGTQIRAFRGAQGNYSFGVGITLPPTSSDVLSYTFTYYWEDRLPVLSKEAQVTRALAPLNRELKVTEGDRRYFGEFAREPGTRPFFGTFSAGLTGLPAGIDHLAEIDGIVKLTCGAGEKTMEIPDVLNATGKSVTDGDTTLTVVKVDKQETGVAVIVQLKNGDKVVEVAVYPNNPEYGFTLVGADGKRVRAGSSGGGGPATNTRPVPGRGGPEPAPLRSVAVGPWGGFGLRGVGPMARPGPGEHGVTFSGKFEGAWTLLYSQPREVWSKEFPFVIKDVPLP